MLWGVCEKAICWWFGCAFALLVVWVRSAQAAASSWLKLGLGYRWKPSWEFSLINITLGQESSSCLVSWTQRSHSRGSGQIYDQGTNFPQIVRYGNKGDLNKHIDKQKTPRNKQTKKNRPQINGKCKIQTNRDKNKEHTHTKQKTRPKQIAN